MNDNRKWNAGYIPAQQGKIIIITGANSGLGYVAAERLVAEGASVIMAVRDLRKGEKACGEIKKGHPGTQVHLMHLDLADIGSINRFSEAFHKSFTKLDTLINNAGVIWPAKRKVTRQGFELQFGVNHLGHFALTGLLLDLLKKTPQSRVVTQSSYAHKFYAGIFFDDINWERKYNKFGAYAQSKLANLLFTYELDRKFKEYRINSLAAAAHPGFTKTNLFRDSGFLVRKAGMIIAQDVKTGTWPILRAATDEQLTGGEYIGPDGFLGLSGNPFITRSGRKSYNINMARQLWAVSEKLTGIIFNFRDS